MTYLENKQALNGGLYFHTTRVAFESDKGIAFPPKRGKKIWFPKSAVHVQLVCQGRVDVWVAEWFVESADKEYDRIERPLVDESTLPTPQEPTTVI